MPRLLVVFALGAEEFAFGVEHVREVVRASDVRRMQSTDPLLLGVLGLRGALVPLYDLAARLGLGTPAAPEGPVVVVELGTKAFGAPVDEVREVLTVDETAIASPPAGTDPAYEAVVQAGERLIVVLRPARLFKLPAAQRTPRPRAP